MPTLTYLGTQTGYVPGLGAFNPGDTRWVDNETAVQFLNSTQFSVADDPGETAADEATETAEGTDAI